MLLCCVKCTSVLDKTRIDDIELDTCPRCGGLWLDHGETERLAKKTSSDIDRLRKILAGRKGPTPVDTEVKLTCPACTGAMNEVLLASVHIDVCSRCKGVFLDRGEVEATIAQVKDQNTTVAQMVAALAVEASA